MKISKSQENRLFGDANEKFVGKTKNEPQIKKLLDLQKLALKLKSLNDLFFECDVEFEDIENRHQNCCVYVRMPQPVLMMDAIHKEILCRMIIGSDVLTVCHLSEGDSIQYTFIVHNVWLP